MQPHFAHSFPNDLLDWPMHLLVERFSANFHGDFDKWISAYNKLPNAETAHPTFADTVAIDGIKNLDVDLLMQFHPWRKGPFQLGEHFINTEWRSDWKWQRLIPHINLRDHRVLDIGCGNGYFGWRMLQAGAQEVVGIDPTLLFCMQHQVINHFVQSNKNWVLPLGIDEIPSHALFDTVMSMGVLYHRRNPQEHIEKMFALCKPKGCAVLETLIVTADKDLIPEDRYARMRNVWCVPRVGSVINSMQQAGFKDVAVVNQCVTTTEEQRSTAWMTFDSLLQTLDPDNSALTIEGHPAPNRAIVIGYRP